MNIYLKIILYTILFVFLTPLYSNYTPDYIEKPYLDKTYPRYMGSIFFNYDSDAIKPEAISHLITITDTITEHIFEAKLYNSYITPYRKFFIMLNYYIYNWRVKIIGYADTPGTKSHNLELALRRANSVAKKLERFGIPKSSIQVASYGKSQSKEINKYLRKVEIWWIPNQGEFPLKQLIIYTLLIIFTFILLIKVIFRKPRNNE